MCSVRLQVKLIYTVSERAKHKPGMVNLCMLQSSFVPWELSVPFSSGLWMCLPVYSLPVSSLDITMKQVLITVIKVLTG